MAFLRRGIGDNDSDINSGSPSTGSSGFVRWFAIPCAAIAFASWLVAILAGLHAAASLAHTGSFVQASLPVQSQLRETPQHKPATPAKTMLDAPIEKSARLATLSATQSRPKAAPAAQLLADPFSKVVAEAKLSREKLVAAFARAGMAISDAEALVEVAFAMPVAERFHRLTHGAAPSPDRLASQSAYAAADVAPTTALGPDGTEIQLAYASVESGWDNTVQLALASLGEDPFGTDTDDVGTADEDMPESALVPPSKPEPGSSPGKPNAAPEPSARKPARASKPQSDTKPEPQKALAFARPDKPGVAGAFKNLFNTPRAGNGVAIYDISASLVHMPDGTRLEAHSGIGKMADNPRFVHVKMNGPTPPNTYKLSMRESRFHGVEAIRMTPVGGGKMHGRDGMLAHSYLLRGGRAESHGCVAFKDYPRFLKAFKQGKVKHLVVVPSLSKAPQPRVASTGRDA